MARPTAISSQAGLAYLALLIIIGGLGGGLAVTGTLWHAAQQRSREAELLFVGEAYRRAIGSYYERSPGLYKTYPRSLDALLRDERFPGLVRHLRRPYSDPLASGNEGALEWGLVRGPEGGIMGIYSQHPGRPWKTANFPPQLGWSEGKKRYAEWQFVYLPASGQAGFGTR